MNVMPFFSSFVSLTGEAMEETYHVMPNLSSDASARVCRGGSVRGGRGWRCAMIGLTA
jgi:hypothetical protein